MPKNKGKGKAKSKGTASAAAAPAATDEWQGLRGTTTVTPTAVAALADITTAGGAAALPDATVLGQMVNTAGALRFKSSGKGKYGESLKGIHFHVAEYVTQGGKAGSKSTLESEFVSNKPSSAVCFENVFLPVARNGQGHILVHQSLAPCANCCNGFKAWAEREGCTIVVSFDEGYDGSGGDGWYIFTPDGNAFSYRPGGEAGPSQ